MSNNYSGKERVKIAENEYNEFKIKDPVTINNDSKTIGEVSQVFDKPTGEQSFVITDHYVSPTAPLSEREKVKEVTILYRGSTKPDAGNLLNPFDENFMDVRADWLENDVPQALGVVSNRALGLKGIPTAQLRSSSNTLQEAMRLYPNAETSIYGQSLGSMNGQYAISDLPEEFHDRISGVYVYEGPNIYSILNEQQQVTANKLTDAGKIFNFVDAKDLIPIGYAVDKKHVGILLDVDSKKTGLMDQHMWGGYQYDKDGNVRTLSSSAMLSAHETNQELQRLDILKKKFIQGGGGLSASQEIFLDAMQAKAITSGYKQSIQSEIEALMKYLKTEIENAHTLWKHTQADAQRWGEHLSYAEEMEALAAGNATEFSIVRQPVNEYENILTMLRSSQSELDNLLNQIKATIDRQVATDKELAQYLS
ncbi:hypothetical protein P4507_001549 [Enterococcus faecalis]|nr:hypothetical protein [Enterococcus faecalis]